MGIGGKATLSKAGKGKGHQQNPTVRENTQETPCQEILNEDITPQMTDAPKDAILLHKLKPDEAGGLGEREGRPGRALRESTVAAHH